MKYVLFENRFDIVVSELVVDIQTQTISIAVLEDKKLVEFHKESRDISFTVGSIYLGKVTKLMLGLNAAFVDVGCDKEAFLHYRDLGSGIRGSMEFLKEISKKGEILPIHFFSNFQKLEERGDITDVLKQGDNVLVQIIKEPISTKGMRVTSELSLVGRYLILMPFSDKVNISSKIQNREERIRLKQLVESIKPKNFSVIVRTYAEGKGIVELNKELKWLVKCWETNSIKLLESKAPSLIYEEIGRVVSLLRDSFNSSFKHIYVNDDEIYHEVQRYIKLIDVRKHCIIKLHRSELPILDRFDVTKQLKSGFGKIVTLKNGSYLIIERTEAMFVIDVNSGNCSSSSVNQEDMTIDINLKAALEIARQLRLRNMGGIIVVDFIDMNEASNRQKLYENMCNFMINDRAKHRIYPISKIGLMEITRKRVRSVSTFEVEESYSSCLGKQILKSSIFFVDLLLEKIKYVVIILQIKKFSLHIHPYVASFIKQGILGIFSLEVRWKFKYSMGMKIIPDQSMDIFGYRFFDAKKNDMIVQEEI